MTFRLAPMSGLISGLTVLVLAAPVYVAAVAFLVPGARLALVVAAAMAAAYAVTWLVMRPRAFVVGDTGLEVVWPARRRRIPWADISGAEEVRPGDLRREFGLLLRVGVGGLWGGFGMAWSSRGRHLGLYVSRHADGFVLVRCRQGRPLLITPERPAAFVAAISARRGTAAV